MRPQSTRNDINIVWGTRVKGKRGKGKGGQRGEGVRKMYRGFNISVQFFSLLPWEKQGTSYILGRYCFPCNSHSVCLSVCLLSYLNLCLSVCLFLCLFFYLDLSVCLFIYLPLHPSISFIKQEARFLPPCTCIPRLVFKGTLKDPDKKKKKKKKKNL